MNKRFSTLLATALVAGGLSANAQTLGKGTVVKEIPASPVRNYVLMTSQFTKDGGIEKPISTYLNGENVLLSNAVRKLTNVNDALWTISFKTVSGSNRFVLTNKATGLTLSIDPANAVAADKDGKVAINTKTPVAAGALDAGIEATEWTWVSGPNATPELKNVKALTSAFDNDSTMSLAITSKGVIYAYKYSNAKKAQLPNGVEQVKIQAVQPGSVNMTAEDLNVLDGGTNGKYFTLSTGKSLKGDVISGVKFQAVNAKDKCVTLKKFGTTKDEYLRVDSAVYAGSATTEDRYYQLAVKGLKKGEAVSTPNHFQISKNLFTDSVSISIEQKGSRFVYAEKADKNNSHWSTAMTDKHKAYDYVTLSSVKLTDDTEVLTLYAAKKKENLLFAVSAPEADNTLTSVADGVYVIQNAKGQYLAVPVYNKGEKAAWVTVNTEEQNPLHMPAYQWVVLKDKTADKLAATSTVTVVNREYPNIAKNEVQLKKENEAAAKYVGTVLLAADSISFDAVPAAILSDSLLGYKYIGADDLLVNRYTFNYLHAYAQDKFISKSAKDSLATVLNGTQPFVVKAVENGFDSYGYEAKNAKDRIKGLKTLYRQSYQVVIPSAKGDVKLGVNEEAKYALSNGADFTASTFYFKENNDLTEGKCYYALIDLTTENVSKAGVTDDDLSATLKNQVISETRTSAFLIAPYDAPLYRRFNSEKLEGNVGDAADTLRFVEKYRNEYLQVENNKNFMVKGIDFLGIYTPDFTKDGKSFIVDTVFVNRWNGNIKPQYLISIDRQDQAFAEGEMCPVCQEIVANGGKRPANCPHDKAGKAPFHMGKYLVNFADSVAANKADYAWKGYTRAGFVKAVHMGDSLYILTGQFADVTLSTFNAEAIAKAVKDGKYDKKYVIDLTEKKDNNSHANVTWAMRFVDPENAAVEEEANRSFLMETDNTYNNIAPGVGHWLKMQNGCLVISGSSDSESIFEQFTDNDDALIFNVEKGAADDLATDNETIATSEVTVIAGEGQVTIANAAGKKVVVSNILGQTVVNTVITSDNAVIAAPQGVVVVAVEGEEAVKAIVK